MILQKLKADAEAYLGENVDKAVITVPAYFNDSQRQATKDAGRIAGLEVLRIINEPTASSLAYGLDKKEDEKIAVYDLGGGTYDISILDLSEGVFEVMATNGDTHLGGDDFDQRIIDWLADEFKKQEGIDLRSDRMALQRLKEAAEKAKIELSSTQQTDINLPFITADAQRPEAPERHADSRPKLEQLVGDLVEATFAPMRAALKDAELAAKTRSTKSCSSAARRACRPCRSKVARFLRQGAAQGRQPGRGRRDRRGDSGRRARRRGQGRAAARCHAADARHRDAGWRRDTADRAQHDDPDAQEPDLHHRVRQPAAGRDPRPSGRAPDGRRQQDASASFILDGIPPAPRGVPQIEVTFDIDANGILNVSAKDQATGREQKITITASSGLTEDEIQRMVREAEAHQPMTTASGARRSSCATRLSRWPTRPTERSHDYGDKIPAELKSELESKIAAVRDILENDRENIDRLKPAYEEMTTTLSRVGTNMYEQAAPTEGAAESEQPGAEDEATVEGEFREVHNEG